MNWVSEYQDLLGTFVALLAAILGFGGVIYSQRAIDRAANEDRKYQEQQLRKQEEMEARRRLTSISNAIVGELGALRLSVEEASKSLQVQMHLATELGKSGRDAMTRPRISFQFQTPVFDAYVGEIGTFSPEISFGLAKLYGTVAALGTHSNIDTPEMNVGLAVKIMEGVDRSLANLRAEIDQVEKLVKNI